VSVVQLMQSRSLGHRSLPGGCRLQLYSMLRILQMEVATIQSAMALPLIVTRELDGRCSQSRRLQGLRSQTA